MSAGRRDLKVGGVSMEGFIFQPPQWGGMPPDYVGPNVIQSPPFVDQPHFVIGGWSPVSQMSAVFE